MRRLDTLRAGDFIDAHNYFKELLEEDFTNYDKFCLILFSEIVDFSVFVNEFVEQLKEITETFSFIYNPPTPPTDGSEAQETIGSQYRQEFVEDYGGYIEITYLLCSLYRQSPKEVLESPVMDFLFWGEYLLRKRFCENIK